MIADFDGFWFSIVIMALEQITGLHFRDKQMLLDVDNDLSTDVRGAMYNSTHFEIPHTFDVSIARLEWRFLGGRYITRF